METQPLTVTMDPNTPTLLGALEAARHIGVHRATLHKLTVAGHIAAAVKLPGRTGARLYTVDALEEYKRTRADADAIGQRIEAEASSAFTRPFSVEPTPDLSRVTSWPSAEDAADSRNEA